MIWLQGPRGPACVPRRRALPEQALNRAEPASRGGPLPTMRASLREAIGSLWLAPAAIVLYVGLEWLSFLHLHDGLPVTPWNPGLGLMLALMILAGTRYALALFVGMLLAEVIGLRSSLPWYAMVAVALVVSACYAAVAHQARRYLHLGQRSMDTRDVVVLFAGGLAGAVGAAALLSLLLLSLSILNPVDIARTAALLVLGDVIGIVVVAPLVLRAAQRHRARAALSRTTIAEIAGFALLVPPLLALTFWPGQNSHGLFYLLFLPVVAAAARHGLDGACAALAFTQVALVAVLHLNGFDLQRFAEYQLLMLVLTLTGLVVGAVVSERQRADADAEAASARLTAMQAEAARAARLNLAAGMAGALAHEISQPMTAARALARSVQGLLAAEPRDHERLSRNAKAMIDQIDHAAAVVRRMREFLGRGNPGFGEVDAGSMLEEAAELARPMARERGIAIVLDLSEHLPAVHGDRVQLQQVVLNLVRNGVDAIAETGRAAGTIAIRTPAPASAREVQIAVIDDGIGIDNGTGTSLFEPLSTTRAEGVGLGLWISRTIMEAHGGRIWLEASSPGRTEFRLALPISAGQRRGDARSP